ncbi:hypothetical protein D3C80_1697990 [compost metagenome]
MAATEAVLGVAPDRADLRRAVILGFCFDGQAADGLAQMARTVMEGLGHGLASYSCSNDRNGRYEHDYGDCRGTVPVAFVS